MFISLCYKLHISVSNAVRLDILLLCNYHVLMILILINAEKCLLICPVWTSVLKIIAGLKITINKHTFK